MFQVKNIVIVGGFDAKLKGAKAIIRRGMMDMAHTWHKEMVPKHFQAGAERKYGYKKRGSKYQRWKQRRNKPPLVASGRTRNAAKAMVRVTGSYKAVRARLFVPRYVKMIPTRPDGPAMGLELVQTTSRERIALLKRLRRRVLRELKALRPRKVVRI